MLSAYMISHWKKKKHSLFSPALLFTFVEAWQYAASLQSKQARTALLSVELTL